MPADDPVIEGLKSVWLWLYEDAQKIAAVVAILAFVVAGVVGAYRRREAFKSLFGWLSWKLEDSRRSIERRIRTVLRRLNALRMNWRKRMKINATDIVKQDRVFKKLDMPKCTRIAVATVTLYTNWVPDNYQIGTDVQIDLIYYGKRHCGDTEFKKLCAGVATWIVENAEELKDTTDSALSTLIIPWDDNFTEWVKLLYADDEDLPW